MQDINKSSSTTKQDIVPAPSSSPLIIPLTKSSSRTHSPEKEDQLQEMACITKSQQLLPTTHSELIYNIPTQEATVQNRHQSQRTREKQLDEEITTNGRLIDEMRAELQTWSFRRNQLARQARPRRPTNLIIRIGEKRVFIGSNQQCPDGKNTVSSTKIRSNIPCKRPMEKI
ncbi:BgTH12-04263 [Blumeria graminis f. sp. triticale]|uniref:BgtAc-31370 n=3 Tax=Blumeria graminis TaxID=34373 RepID=A0A9X9PRJ9_BLUGR|nr:hypothetical protein BGT96224_Ac31370 [Blumeria graminis f. sp. tritici 96224]CAD6500160.1 BgTH12-04263 [Blumeria graminis f. sp. triticale]VCU40399.1 BgtAc-31370 [Blumeria graminis f. sp. tritici]